jgi:hypothetical protein
MNTMTYLHATYADHLDLIGKDVISLSGASREQARELFPMLKDTSDMNTREALPEALQAYNGELADEVHEFSDARQGTFRVTRLLLKGGRVVEVTLQF